MRPGLDCAKPKEGNQRATANMLPWGCRRIGQRHIGGALMRSHVERLENNRVAIEVGLGADEVAEALGKAYKRVARKVKIPGFRPGTAPRSVLEARFGKEVLYEDAADIIVPEAYRQALAEHALSPIDQPKLTVLEPIEEGKDFVFQATVEVLPEVGLGEYRKIKAQKPPVKVEEEQVRERLEALRDQYAELVLAQHEQVQKGDFAVVDFEGYIDGQPFPGGAAKGYTVETEGGSYLPGFAEGIVGMSIGETREIKVRFPDGAEEHLAGKEAIFQVTLHEIKIKERPEIDAEFAKSLGYDTVEALTEKVRATLEEAAKKEAERVFTERVVEQVVKGAAVEVPALLIDRESADRFESLRKNLEYRGETIENYLGHFGKTEDELRAEMRREAEAALRRELVLDAVRKAEGIEPTEEEIAGRVAELAALTHSKDPERFRRELEKRGRIAEIKENLAREKTVKFLAEQAEAVSQ